MLVAGRTRKLEGQLLDVDVAALTERVARSRTAIQQRYDALPPDVIDGAWGGIF